MTLPGPADPIMQKIIDWANAHDPIRAVLLTSNRAIPGASTDALSDYDIILVVQDIHPFVNDPSWLDEFGKVLVAYWDNIHVDQDFGIEVGSNVIQYYGGLKIDFNLWPVDLFRKIVAGRNLPVELDAGYRVLLDKEKLADAMLPPTGKGFIPKPPAYDEYFISINNFLSDAPYVAKFLWRDEVIPAKRCLEDMKQLHLVPMLGWWVEIQHQWSVKLGFIGRGLKKYLPPDLWEAIEQTYASASVEENWLALERTLQLFREVALKVGEQLGYTFPEEMHAGVKSYVDHIRHLPHPV